jgi:hypothetical protein
MKNVELFKDYYQQYGTTVSDEKVRAFLRSKGSVDVVQLSQIAEEIGKLLSSLS